MKNSTKPTPNANPVIRLLGLGEAGVKLVEPLAMIGPGGIETYSMDTDNRSLARCHQSQTFLLGQAIPCGLGTGGDSALARAAVESDSEHLAGIVRGADLVFIVAGMGGGTGTGAAPVIARAAREQGILTVGVVTKPFQFEGSRRMKIAEAGIEELQQFVDTLIIIPNQNLFRIANEKTTFADAFKMADDVLYSGVRGVTDLMVMPGLINLDFADIRTVMSEMGKAMMGTGEADGEKRAIEAAERAISNPLLDDVTMKGAKGVLINITGGGDMTLFEVDEAANRIREEVDPEANIIFGSTFEETLEGTIRVSVVATGIEAAETSEFRPLPIGLTTVNASVKREEDAKPEAKPATEPPEEEPVPAVAESIGPAEATAGQEPTRPAGRPAFIPPRPARPGDAKASQSVAEPFAVAAMENALSETPKPGRKALSLFERMTGSGRQQTAVKAAEPENKPTVAMSLPPMADQPERPGQPSLEGLGSADSPSPSAAEEKMLEIPAFLRRQAN